MFKKIKEFFSGEDFWAKCDALITLTVSEKMSRYEKTIYDLINKQSETIKKQEETIKKQSEQIDKLMNIHTLEFEIYDLQHEVWNLEYSRHGVQRDMDVNQGRTEDAKKKLDRLRKKKYDIDYGKHHG